MPDIRYAAHIRPGITGYRQVIQKDIRYPYETTGYPALFDFWLDMKLVIQPSHIPGMQRIFVQV